MPCRLDDVSATPRHRDAVDVAVRQSTRRVREPRPCRDGICTTQVKFEEKRELALAAKEAKKTAVEKVKEADEAAQPLREERDRAERARQRAVWTSKFGRPTPSTRRLCDCICSMA